jgi:hypothetical protein
VPKMRGKKPRKQKKHTKCKTKKRRPCRQPTAGEHQALQRKRNTTPDLVTLSTGKQQQQRRRRRSKRKQENRTRKHKSREEKTHTLLPSTKPHFCFLLQ